MVLVDVERAVAGALHRYARLLDERNWRNLDTVFSPDATAVYGDDAPLHGLAAISAGIRAYVERCRRTRHAVSNIEVEEHDGRFRSRCYVVASHVGGDPAAAPLHVYGEYRVTWTASTDALRAVEWRMIVAFSEGDPAILGLARADGDPPALSADDHAAIQALVHRYPLLLDAGEIDEVGALFAHADVFFEGSPDPVHHDSAEIARRFRDWLRLYDGKPRTRHQMANLIIAADGSDRARATCSVTVFQQTDALPLQPIITGDYRDRFERVEGEWRFAERHIANDLFGNLSAHGRYEIAHSA